MAKCKPDRSEIDGAARRRPAPHGPVARAERSGATVVSFRQAGDPGPAHRRAIEHYAGTVSVPVGLAGPLRIKGDHARGDYRVPLATTEAALVASYCRGAAAISAAGGCNSVVLGESINRTPAFTFRDAVEARAFAAWASSQVARFREVAQSTTTHGRLTAVSAVVEGNRVYLDLAFTTAEAAGQNMITVATAAVCDFVDAAAPRRPRMSLVDGNLSGDKKACARSFGSVRGKRATADVRLPDALLRRRLGVTPRELVECWRVCAVGGVLSGSLGIQGHFANALAAVYLACGQDIACVAESAVGITRFEEDDDGGLYAAVTLPNLVVGTIGGGTGLPEQRAWLDSMGLSGPDSARAFAEICAALCLAGELSLAAAVRSGVFARAHDVLRRGRAPRQSDVPG
jgi:hydroxymethylglutaryl-CoA reductase (NADPH)